MAKKNGKSEKTRKGRNPAEDVPRVIETLYDIGPGETAWVTSIQIEEANMRRRLQDLGIVEGTRVLCRQSAPSGNPKSYLVRGATIAIRKGDSSRVLVSTDPPVYPDDVKRDWPGTADKAADGGDAAGTQE